MLKSTKRFSTDAVLKQNISLGTPKKTTLESTSPAWPMPSVPKALHLKNIGLLWKTQLIDWMELPARKQEIQKFWKHGRWSVVISIYLPCPFFEMALNSNVLPWSIWPTSIQQMTGGFSPPFQENPGCSSFQLPWHHDSDLTITEMHYGPASCGWGRWGVVFSG